VGNISQCEVGRPAVASGGIDADEHATPHAAAAQGISAISVDKRWCGDSVSQWFAHRRARQRFEGWFGRRRDR